MYINSIFIILVFLYFYGCVNLSKRITRGSAGRSTEPKDEAMVCGSDCNHLLGYLPNKHLLFIKLAFNNPVSNRATTPIAAHNYFSLLIRCYAPMLRILL